MDSFTTILNILEIPTSTLKEIINLYQHCLKNNETCELNCTINSETKAVLSNCLMTNPFETISIIEKIHFFYEKKHNKPFIDLISNVLIENLERFTKYDNNEIDVKNIYSLLSLLEHSNNWQKIFPIVLELIADKKINKNLLYFVLMSQKNILKQFIEFEKMNFIECDIKNTTSLFRFCLYKNEHWFINIINNDINELIHKDINKKIFFLKLINVTNTEQIDYNKIQEILLKLNNYQINDQFLRYYIAKTKWNLKMYHFLNETKPEKINKYKFTYSNSCIDTLSSFIDLKQIDLVSYIETNKLLFELEHFKSELNTIKTSDLDLYNGLCLIMTIKNYIFFKKTDSSSNDLLRNIENQLFQTSNLDFLLEIFENIFAMIFLQNKHLEGTKDGHVFLCGYKEIFYICSFLNEIIIKLKRKYFAKRDKPKQFLRYNIFSRFVRGTLLKLNILETENILQNDEEVINFLVSSPKTLLYYCLENDNIDLAQQVIRDGGIQNTEIANDIEFAEKIQQLKNENNAETLIKFCSTHLHSNAENPKNDIFMNLLDVVLTHQQNYETSEKILNEAFKNETIITDINYAKFCKNLQQIFENICSENNQTIMEILTNSKYPFNLNKFNLKENHLNQIDICYNQYQENKTNIIFEQFLQISENKFEDVNYLKKIYNYLQKLNEIFRIKNAASSSQEELCVFDLIEKNTARIVGELLFKFNLQPKDFEKLFLKLKLDIVYKISWNFLPEIELNINEEKPQIHLKESEHDLHEIIEKLKGIYSENNEENKVNNVPDIFLLSYIQKRNWLLAYLMNKIYFKDTEKQNINSDQTKYFKNSLNINSIKKLKMMFEENSALAVLYSNEMIFAKLLQFIDAQNGNKNWDVILEIIAGIPETLQLNNKDLIHIKDLIIYNLISSTNDNKLIEVIHNNHLRVKCILENLQKWPGQFCIKILKCELSRWDLDEEQEEIIKKKYFQIDLYENIKNTFINLISWNEVYEKSTKNPNEIFLLLLTSKEMILLLKWIEIHKPNSLELLPLITINYFALLLENNTDIQQIKTLLDLLQFDQRVAICKNLLKQIKICEYNDFIINYLITLLPELESEYKNIIISLKIFSCFNSIEHEYMYCLINKPSLIIEQLIMNVRLEKLQFILEKIKPILKDASERKIPVDLSIESVDELLRNYAKKAVDFRGIQPSAELKIMELKLMQSLDTVSVDSERKNFLIPDKVPDKNNWVQNEQALECMCCREVIFSMFNRRHHCRRCGRVICGNCSLKKMQIPEYGTIPVRVCNDCFKQTDESNIINKSEQSSNKSGSLTCWLLTDDEKHNEIAREEFSFEYAPSVSLCLSILKAHSNNIQYPRFLLDQCKILLPYLQDGISEIDFSFMIQMIKSLVTVAKLSSLTNSYKTELMECNEILLQIELMNLLVEKDCLELLQSSIINSNDYYNHSRVLRRLRDKLIEQEYWNLALDISTKVGLDKTGIFAAWGKSYLKSGSLQMAREKFQYCFEQKNIYDLESSVSVSYEDRFKSINLSTVSENRPIKTPPLINEIIYVLENNDFISATTNNTSNTVFQTFKSSNLSLNTNDSAICILNKLKNLKNLTDPTTATTTRHRKNFKKIEPCFYNECLYYLMRYASHSTILHFYSRHQEFDEVLNYILENRLPNEYFVEIYVKCLEENKIENLHETMRKIDCTLDSWEIYLKSICRHLETNKMFNVLYELQLFMCDYVRAAMTCIKFYQENANHFRELLSREEFLYKAQNHLKQELEHEQWVKVTPVRKSSTTSSNSSTSKTSNQLLMKIDPRNIDRYINTIWRQIEVCKFLAECEIENRPTLELLTGIFVGELIKPGIPTLFGTNLEKIKLAVMALVCGKNIEEGFGIAFRIIQDHNLKYLKIYCLAGKYLATILHDSAVIELINCIKSSGLNMETVNETCDDVLMVAVDAFVKADALNTQFENVIKMIYDPGNKIDAYIVSKQLKRAYLLAIKHNKISDIRKILREAEKQNQPQIKAICLKRLNQSK